MADERTLDRDDEEFENAIRKNPYAQLPSNSSKSLEVEAKHVPRVNPVVTGGPRTMSRVEKKKSEFSEIMSNVGKYIWNDVLKPTVKDVLYSIINNSADMIIYRGEGRGRRKGDRSYSSYYRRSSDNDRRREYYPEREIRRPAKSWDDIFLPEFNKEGKPLWTRKLAEQVLVDMYDIQNDYDKHRASVADLLDLCGYTAEPIDERKGWYKGELRGSCVRRCDGGFLLCTPDPEYFEEYR